MAPAHNRKKLVGRFYSVLICVYVRMYARLSGVVPGRSA